MYKKIVNLKTEQKDALNEIQQTVKENGGYVSIMRLTQDSIQIFIDHYRDEAINRYSPAFYNKKGDV